MEISLAEARLNIPAVVTGIEVKDTLKNRLRDFGFVPGTQVCCRYRSPGKQVIAVELRGTVLALRARDLRNIRVRC